MIQHDMRERDKSKKHKTPRRARTDFVFVPVTGGRGDGGGQLVVVDGRGRHAGQCCGIAVPRCHTCSPTHTHGPSTLHWLNNTSRLLQAQNTMTFNISSAEQHQQIDRIHGSQVLAIVPKKDRKRTFQAFTRTLSLLYNMEDMFLCHLLT